jgi:aspartyl/asparaginyl beta-hydroxylase (cupin superfamily)
MHLPDSNRGSVPERFHSYIAGLRENTHGNAARMARYPSLSSNAFYDPSSFPLARALEESASEIVKEFAALRPSDFHRESEAIARTGDWDIFMLFERGKINEQNCQACPITSKTIFENGGMQTLSGLAYFSRLAPGTRIAPHAGPTNVRLRCHLGIKVSPFAGIRVDGQERSWTEGKCLVLNDALQHEAWNLGGEERVVLVVDLWHPDLTSVEVELLEGLQRYAFAHAENLTKYWEKNDRARTAGLIESGSNGAVSK